MWSRSAGLTPKVDLQHFVVLSFHRPQTAAKQLYEAFVLLCTLRAVQQAKLKQPKEGNPNRRFTTGIIVIGGMLQLGGPLTSAKVSCALLSVFFSSINIVGGFAVTERMLQMFKSETDAVTKDATPAIANH